MKYIFQLLFCSTLVFAHIGNSYSSNGNAKFIINLQNNFGYTIVDVAQAIEIPEYSDFSNEGLGDWDQFNYKGLIQLFIPRNNFFIGSEVGFNRLYRWEERYQTFDGYDRWR